MLNLGRLKQYADVFSKGLVQEMAPEIAAGILVELIRRWRIDTPTIVKYVEANHSIWDKLSDHDHERLRKAMRRVGTTKWVTPEWFINAIKKDYPAIASLILGWPEAQDWLEEQIERLKRYVIEESDE